MRTLILLRGHFAIIIRVINSANSDKLFFIFTAIWENEFYYLFGFLFLVFVILIIASSQIAIVMVYFQVIYIIIRAYR